MAMTEQNPSGSCPVHDPSLPDTITSNLAYHTPFMLAALSQAELALATNETPVGCVFVHNNQILSPGHNATNATLNGTRHAEIEALDCIMEAGYPLEMLQETDLYVTVEPCIMCASVLRQVGIRRVFFGCGNQRFGGNGGVLSVNEGNGLEKGYESYGGLFREEAVLLLRRFYVQTNERAPRPQGKKGRKLNLEVDPP